MRTTMWTSETSKPPCGRNSLRPAAIIHVAKVQRLSGAPLEVNGFQKLPPFGSKLKRAVHLAAPRTFLSGNEPVAIPFRRDLDAPQVLGFGYFAAIGVEHKLL